MEHVIYTTATREDIRRITATIPAILGGRLPDQLGLALGFRLRIGVAFLTKVQEAFTVKSRGGTDEAGISWTPLSKAYLAYGRRFARGEQAALKRAAGLGSSNHHGPGMRGGLLSAAQLTRWQQVFARNMRWLMPLYGEAKAKGIAAGIAWNVLKSEGAKTKLEVFGNRQVEILKDTGILFRSISPGVLTVGGGTASYAPTPNQIMRNQPGELIVGTTVPYAAAQHKRRPLWPESDQIPASWLDSFSDVAASGLVQAVYMLVKEIE